MASGAWRCFDEAPAALLIQTAEARMMALESREGLQGGRDSAQDTLRDSRAQERVALSGSLCEERRAPVTTASEPALARAAHAAARCRPARALGRSWRSTESMSAK